MFHAEVRGSSPTSANLAPRPSSCRGLTVGGVLADGVPLWAVSPLVVLPPAVFGGCPPPVPLSRVAASFHCLMCSPFSGVPAPGRPPGAGLSQLSSPYVRIRSKTWSGNGTSIGRKFVLARRSARTAARVTSPRLRPSAGYALLARARLGAAEPARR